MIPALVPARLGWNYRFFDRCLVSSVALPELPGFSRATRSSLASLCDPLVIGCACQGQWPAGAAQVVAASSDGPVTTVKHGEAFLVCAHRRALLLADPATRRVQLAPGVAADAALRHLLLDDVLPRLLGQAGNLVLHGSAVVVDGRVIVLLGPSGSGKSTLGALLACQGGSLLADDAVLLRSGGRPQVIGSYPGARLWPESARLLDAADRAASTPFLPGHPKRRYRLRRQASGALTADGLPIELVLLEPHHSEGAAVRIWSDGPAADALGVLRCVFQFQGDGALTLRRLRAIDALLDAGVRLWRASVREGLDALPRAAAALVEGLRAR